MHPLPIDSITRKDIAERIVAIARQNGSVTAARVRANASALYTWAMQMGLTDSNPVIGSVQPKESEGSTRVLTDAELAAVWRAAWGLASSICNGVVLDVVLESIYNYDLDATRRTSASLIHTIALENSDTSQSKTGL